MGVGGRLTYLTGQAAAAEGGGGTAKRGVSCRLVNILFLFDTTLKVKRLNFTNVTLTGFFHFFINRACPIDLTLFNTCNLCLVLEKGRPGVEGG